MMEETESRDSFNGTFFIDGVTTDGNLLGTLEISDGIIIDDYFQVLHDQNKDKEEEGEHRLSECPEKFDIFCTPTTKNSTAAFGVK